MENETKTAWDSTTIKAAVSAIVINVLTLVAIFTGRTFDIATIQAGIDYGIPLIVNMVSAYLGYKALVGRFNATQPIAKKDK